MMARRTVPLKLSAALVWAAACLSRRTYSPWEWFTSHWLGIFSRSRDSDALRPSDAGAPIHPLVSENAPLYLGVMCNRPGGDRSRIVASECRAPDPACRRTGIHNAHDSTQSRHRTLS